MAMTDNTVATTNGHGDQQCPDCRLRRRREGRVHRITEEYSQQTRSAIERIVGDDKAWEVYWPVRAAMREAVEKAIQLTARDRAEP